MTLGFVAKMSGFRAIEVDYDGGAEEVSELLIALDDIFSGFGGYSTGTSPNGGQAAPSGDSSVSGGPPSVS